MKGTFERTCRGPAPAAGGGAPQARAAAGQHQHDRRRTRRLDTLEQMVDVAEELGVDAIGLNHLMFSTPPRKWRRRVRMHRRDATRR